ncbi:hypothetical protein GCM10011514_46820 [Emticicia aquatilis]|uniref:DUF1684 domain-containing protein n=1 Tax=Emticicia aquatilis TaxID=1537369 RepID=A0A917DX98_9BACT|nr:DUF1684 domain-containing protein [Emticicia aquatilis]GGD77555.1 hypothetical protein GCM10011514_46820 [Emticicia aquatilis]
MKKLIFAVIAFVPLTILAQDFKAEIEKHREEYKADFLKNSSSPLKKEDFEYLRFYEPNEKFKVVCEFVATKKREKSFEVPTSSGQTATYTKFGELKFEIDGKPYKLAVYQSLKLRNLPQYRDYLFIPFKDLTNGKESYGGGRYLDLRMKEISGDKIYLDFNKAYNPYCAFSAGYSCPIPPKENHLKVAIEAGEKNFAKEH